MGYWDVGMCADIALLKFSALSHIIALFRIFITRCLNGNFMELENLWNGTGKK